MLGVFALSRGRGKICGCLFNCLTQRWALIGNFDPGMRAFCAGISDETLVWESQQIRVWIYEFLVIRTVALLVFVPGFINTLVARLELHCIPGSRLKTSLQQPSNDLQPQPRRGYSKGVTRLVTSTRVPPATPLCAFISRAHLNARAPRNVVAGRKALPLFPFRWNSPGTSRPRAFRAWGQVSSLLAVRGKLAHSDFPLSSFVPRAPAPAHKTAFFLFFFPNCCLRSSRRSTLVGNYILGEEIGKGAYGQVIGEG